MTTLGDTLRRACLSLRVARAAMADGRTLSAWPSLAAACRAIGESLHLERYTWPTRSAGEASRRRVGRILSRALDTYGDQIRELYAPLCALCGEPTPTHDRVRWMGKPAHALCGLRHEAAARS